MALIIKGEMPKGKCWWHDEQGKEHECQFFPCNAIYCLDSEDRKEMCLIIAEIPNKHGRLIDADELIAKIKRPLTYHSGVCASHVQPIIDSIESAPTVLEATE